MVEHSAVKSMKAQNREVHAKLQLPRETAVEKSGEFRETPAGKPGQS